MTNEVEVVVSDKYASKGGFDKAKKEVRELGKEVSAASKNTRDFNKDLDKSASTILSSFLGASKGVLNLGSAVSSAQGVAGAVAAVGKLSGSAAALPGILAAGAAAGGVFKLAMAGMGDAIAAKDMEEFNELTKEMGPNAVKTASAIRDQKDRFTELKKIVQDNFFRGFNDDIRDLGDKYFPILKDRSGEIASEWNLMGREASKALLAPEAIKAVNTVLGDSRDGLKEMRPALGNVLAGIISLSAVGSSRFKLLGRGINGVTEDFRRWVDEGVKSGRINKIIDDGVDSAKQLGRVLGNVGDIGQAVWKGLSSGGGDFLGNIEKSTQALEDFLNSAEGQDALKTLGETLGVAADVTRDVFTAALKQAGPIIKELGPVAQELARSIGDTLVAGIEIAGPLLKDLAEFLSDNKEMVGDLVPLVLGLAVAYKGLNVAKDAAGWVRDLTGLFGKMGTSAKLAAAEVGVAGAGAAGGLAGRLAALAVPAAATGAALLSAGGDARHEPMDRWTRSTVSKAQQPAFGLTPVTLRVDANTEEAQSAFDKLVQGINKTAGTVNINGNDTGAAFALRQILSEIAAGKESVTIDGKQVPAQEALSNVLNLINTSTGTLTVNGNEVPAGQVLTSLLGRINSSWSSVNVGANTANAQGVIDGFIRMNNGRTIQIYTSVLGSGGMASAGRLATGGISSTAHAATGGARGGDTIINEQGPENVRLPNGSTVINAGTTRRLEKQMFGDGAMGGGPMTIVLELDGKQIAAVLVDPLKGVVRKRGGRPEVLG